MLATWKALCSSVGELELFWQFHVRFCGDDQDLAMMVDILPCAFRIIRKGMLFTILMQLRSLLDPARSHGRDNVSLARLMALLQKDNPTLHASLTVLLRTIRTHCEPIEQWGNRRAGHADLRTALSEDNLPEIPKEHFEEALKLIRQLLVEVHTYFHGRGAPFELALPLNEADKLLDYIRRGRQAELDEFS